MFIKKIEIKNFRIFPSDKNFEIDNIKIPNGNLGSGLTVLVGENGCGKTTILEALALTWT
jgi:DNA repair exonuclease SbcCD ATPase subunit